MRTPTCWPRRRYSPAPGHPAGRARADDGGPGLRSVSGGRSSAPNRNVRRPHDICSTADGRSDAIRAWDRTARGSCRSLPGRSFRRRRADPGPPVRPRRRPAGSWTRPAGLGLAARPPRPRCSRFEGRGNRPGSAGSCRDCRVLREVYTAFGPLSWDSGLKGAAGKLHPPASVAPAPACGQARTGPVPSGGRVRGSTRRDGAGSPWRGNDDSRGGRTAAHQGVYRHGYR